MGPGKGQRFEDGSDELVSWLWSFLPGTLGQGMKSPSLISHFWKIKERYYVMVVGNSQKFD